MALFCVISANSGSFRAHCVKVHVRYLISWWVLVTLCSELCRVLFFALWHFCLCMKYLVNRWMDLRQIHRVNVFSPSLGRVWMSWSKVKVTTDISGITELICDKFTGKMCLVPRSGEFEGQGQMSRSPGTKKRHFFGPFRWPVCGFTIFI